MALYAGAVLLVFFLRIIGVAIGTVRILLTNRGNEWWSAVLGFFEVLVYVVGIGVVVKDLTDITMLMRCCLGFSVGTILGIRVEQRMALGFVNQRQLRRDLEPRRRPQRLRRPHIASAPAWLGICLVNGWQRGRGLP